MNGYLITSLPKPVQTEPQTTPKTFKDKYNEFRQNNKKLLLVGFVGVMLGGVAVDVFVKKKQISKNKSKMFELFDESAKTKIENAYGILTKKLNVTQELNASKCILEFFEKIKQNDKKIQKHLDDLIKKIEDISNKNNFTQDDYNFNEAIFATFD